MKNKWFIINEKNKTFKSKRRAKTKAEAWDKTLLKWGLKDDGYKLIASMESAACGWCNYIKPKTLSTVCPECILGNDEGCMAFNTNPALQYLWLLFVREAST